MMMNKQWFKYSTCQKKKNPVAVSGLKHQIECKDTGEGCPSDSIRKQPIANFTTRNHICELTADYSRGSVDCGCFVLFLRKI